MAKKQARRVRQERIQRRRRKARDWVVVPVDGMGDIKQLAELCQVSPRTARRLVEAGILPPPIRLGPRTVRWDMAQVRALLTAAASGQTPMPPPALPAPAIPKRHASRRGARRTRARAAKSSDLTDVNA